MKRAGILLRQSAGLCTLLAAGSIILLSGCGSQDGRRASTDVGVDTTNRPDAVVAGASILLYKGKTITTEIKSELIHKFDEIDSTMGYAVDIDILDSTGNVVSTIVSDSGVIREKENFLNLFGHVVVLTDDSTRLETDYLRWDPDRNKIETEAFVKITQEGDIITGWGLESDRSLSHIKILRQVSGTVEKNESFDTSGKGN